MAGFINRVVLVGNLTRDPELRQLPSGTSVCSIRLAVNDRIKDKETGEWRDQPGYFDVDVFGPQAERYNEWLKKGRQIAVDGRLRWREWQTQEGQKRQSVSVVADNVQFIGPRDGGSGGGTGYGDSTSRPSAPGVDYVKEGLDVAGEDFARDDDIPF